jgi:phosphoserine phosphatase RsbU/P
VSENVSQDAAAATPENQVRDLLSVLDLSCQLAATQDLQTLLENITRAARTVLDCERASVFLYDAQTDELYSRVATDLVGVRFPSHRGIAGEVFRTRSPVNIPDAYADPRFNPEIDRRTGFTTRSILSCPLLGWDNAPVGVLQVLNKRTGGFGSWDEVLAKTFSAQAGVAVQRQLLLEEFAKKQRFERELDLARQIQQGLLPRRPPVQAGFDIAGWNQPADETGGDFFDFKELAGGNFAVTIADVSGHGIGPALVVAECRALVRASLVQTEELDRLTPLVNRLLCEDVPDDCFVTVFFSVLDSRTARLRYLSAGQGPILYYRAATDEFRDLPTQGCPLGFAADLVYDPPVEIEFGPGDILAVLTDGFFEWPNGERQQFGVARVCDCLRRYQSLPAAQIIQNIYQDVRAFGNGTAQRDDLTAVIVKKV